MRRKLHLLIIIIVLLIFTSYFMMKREYELSKVFDETIILDNDKEYSQKFNVENLSLKPGDVIEYRIAIRSEEECIYEISFNFDEVIEGELKKYVDVEISNGRQRYNRKLNYLLENDSEVMFICGIVPTRDTVFCIKYIMPDYIGNEAMNAYSKFSIELKAKNLWGVYEKK